MCLFMLSRGLSKSPGWYVCPAKTWRAGASQSDEQPRGVHEDETGHQAAGR